MTEETRALPRKREIEAAFAAYNRIDRETATLPPSALRLLTVMFPRSDVCRRSVASLAQEGFDAPDAAAAKKVAVDIQLRAFENVPYWPLGSAQTATAFQPDITGVNEGFVTFWNVRRT